MLIFVLTFLFVNVFIFKFFILPFIGLFAMTLIL